MSNASYAEDESRRAEELDALRAFYGDNVQVENESAATDGPWRIHLLGDDASNNKVVLELLLPLNYPSQAAPSPLIHAPPWILNESYAADLVNEMIDMWAEDTEVAILWAEHCRSVLDINGEGSDQQVEDENDQDISATESERNIENEGIRTFHPYTSKYGQPIRHFDASVILNESNRRDIHRGKAFHPPKSGPSETMIAHVASVHSMDHVNWVLAQLLFGDKKVAKATHNMIAYRFWDPDRDCMVSDNDDDGEKGAGSKLAALLEMADARDVIVVVSRWFGGVLLGPSRFKHIASTAREALDEAGFLNQAKK